MLSLLAKLNWPFLVLWAAVALSGVCIDRYRRSRRFGKLRGCQTSHKQAQVKDPFIGLDFIHERVIRGLSGRRLLDCIEKFKQYGSTYSVDRLTYQVVQTCDPENLKQVLATGFDDFALPSSRVSVMGELLGSGIFTLDGDLWSHARAILRPSLAKHKMDRLPSILEHHVQQFLTHIPRQGEEVDLQPLFFELTMDIATEFLMGYSSNMLDPSRKREKEQQFFDDYMLCSEEAIKKMSYGPLRFFRLNLAATKAKKRVFKYMDEYIEECFERQDGTAEMTDKENAFQEIASAITDRQSLRDQLLHFLLASRDTTASLLSNLFFVLAKNPQTYARLRSEVLSKVAFETPTFSGLRDIEYLRWCVNESLRLHPVIPSNGREATRDTTLPRGGGTDGKSPLFLRKGAVVLYNVFSMHRDPAIFGDRVDEFVPERWSGLRPGWGFLPFSGGPRVCVGQHFALIETYYLVTRIVQTFERLESKDPREWVELPGLAMTCRNGNKVGLYQA
ncbi:unnamed protein product [Clonostachys solani]|uniref:Cytochrome P450 alkane hydroxylase n=1 Tax=Clonostachys solani TaxID=160281 RepID=A0A9P0EE70_9HYPO|nr:unnamed protein product [Clonostachys solani]